MKSTFATALVALNVLSVTSAGPLKRRDNVTMAYSFSDVQPSAELKWTPCFDNFTCAMLEVPLDYTDPSIGSTGVAFIKNPSSNASAQDILINPGGPGGSGVDLVLHDDGTLRTAVGPGYNLIGFDPRGVNNSDIRLTCFPGDLAAEIRFDQDFLDAPTDDSSQTTFYEKWELARGWGTYCTEAQGANMTKKYANTVAVANDMRHYTELVAQSLGQPAEQSKLWYWGISYGTLLGQTYATLFPDRIGRMILDGNINAADYYGGAWEMNLFDTDAAAADFFSYCFEAGPQLCAFAGNATGPADLENRFFKLWNNLRERPILVSDPKLSVLPILVGWQELQTIFFTELYHPIPGFPSLASMLVELEQGNGTSLAISSGRYLDEYPVNPTDYVYLSGVARTQIACIDANGRFNTSTLEKFETHFNLLRNQSFFGSYLWSAIVATPCWNFHVSPPASQLFTGIASANNTAAPILFIGNTHDPVTPHRVTVQVSGNFKGSEVLTVNGTGHSSYNVPSTCVYGYMQGYLADTTLPPAGTICQPALLPFAPETVTGPQRRRRATPMVLGI